MLAATAGGHTIGPSVGAFSTIFTGMSNPYAVTVDPDSSAQVHSDAPNASRHSPSTIRPPLVDAASTLHMTAGTNTAAALQLRPLDIDTSITFERCYLSEH